MGYSPGGRKESDMTDQLRLFIYYCHFWMRDRSGIQAGSEDGTFWCHKSLSPGKVVNHIIRNKKRKCLPCPGRRTCHVLHTMSCKFQMASKDQLFLQKELSVCKMALSSSVLMKYVVAEGCIDLFGRDQVEMQALWRMPT